MKRIIELIIDRMINPANYKTREFYANVLQCQKDETEQPAAEAISRAMDAGEEDDVIGELSEYIYRSSGCRCISNQLIDWVSRQKWLEDAPKRTPLQLWHHLKSLHPDHIILFRCGDFYRAIGEDARVCVNTLGITLLNRNDDNPCHPQVECAFPHHALDTYLPRLIRKGYRVCIGDED